MCLCVGGREKGETEREGEMQPPTNKQTNNKQTTNKQSAAPNWALENLKLTVMEQNAFDWKVGVGSNKIPHIGKARIKLLPLLLLLLLLFL